VEKAIFLAAFPAIQSAIKVTGDASGMRVQLDIPESEMGEAVKVLAWRQMVLRVTIEPEQQSKVVASTDPVLQPLIDADAIDLSEL
jgi:hypothetical protein